MNSDPTIRPNLEFRLTAYDSRGFQYTSPEPAYLCDKCGAVVVMPFVHEGFHAEREEESS